MDIVAYVFGGALLVLALLFFRTYRARARNLGGVLLPGEEVLMEAPRIPVRAMSLGTGRVLGLDPKRAVRLTGRMAMSQDHFVLVTDQGRFADVRSGKPPLLTSVRCTAPGRLVIEGTVPQVGRQPGVYRLEIMFTDAEKWALALQPFVDPNTPKFGVVPPTRKSQPS